MDFQITANRLARLVRLDFGVFDETIGHTVSMRKARATARHRRAARRSGDAGADPAPQRQLRQGAEAVRRAAAGHLRHRVALLCPHRHLLHLVRNLHRRQHLSQCLNHRHDSHKKKIYIWNIDYFNIFP